MRTLDQEMLTMLAAKDGQNRGPQPGSTSLLPSLAIIADDLTGACDAAVPFTGISPSVQVSLSGKLSDTPIFAITTQTRDISPAEAETYLKDIALKLPAHTQVFKKIDSVFRGNTALEIRASIRHFPFDLAILAPAYPALNRRMKNGVFSIQDAAGSRTLSVTKTLAELDCHPQLLPTGLPLDTTTAEMQRCLATPEKLILCDAQEQSDLTNVVRAARSLNLRILWIGSGGLAHALAAEFAPAIPQPDPLERNGETVFFIGSDHPATQSQVAHLLQNESYGHRLHHIVPGQTSAEDIRRTMADIDPTNLGCLFMTGGDTAFFVCRALGIESLHLQREFAPGVPLAIAQGGNFHGVPVVLKSGGFGEANLMSRLLATFGKKQEVPA
jgi:D-threonate/D-erythronate kinase